MSEDVLSDRQAVSLYGTDADAEAKRAALRSGGVPVAVYGLGKMGLPLAASFSEATGSVVGVDVDESVVRSVNRGECHVEGEPGLAPLVAEQVEAGRLSATGDLAHGAAWASVHVVIVPTPLTDANEPDTSILEDVVEGIAPHVAPGDLVLVESTVPPGTCEGAVAPHVAAVGDVEEGEFGVAFCPERTASGRALRDIRGAYPKVVGGVDEASTDAAALVYDLLTDNEVIRVADATTAETVKLFEGVYRDVNIALANELATMTDDLGVDVRDAIAAANTQPLCDILDPGPGVGGHCIPWYPYFLMDRVSVDAPLLRAARGVNDDMPAFTVDRLERAVEAAGGSLDGATVAVLGVTYRAGVAETRATPAAPIATSLVDRGATVLLVDPMVDDLPGVDAEPVALADLPDRDPDAAVVVTAHPEFEDLDWSRFDDVVVVDSRDSIPGGRTDHRVYTIGRGPGGGADGVE